MNNTFRKPDLNAPRRKRKRYAIATQAFFAKFRRHFPQYKAYTDPQLSSIIKASNQLLWETACNTKDGIELPQRLGAIFLGMIKIDRCKIKDYGTSIKSNTEVYARNLGTDGHLGKIIFTNHTNKSTLIDSDIWEFEACRNFSRAASKKFKEDWHRYQVIPMSFKPSDLLKKRRIKDFAVKRSKEFFEENIENYNEFDL
jgi:hypothetical protein